MVDFKLVNYIKAQISKGYTKDELKEILKKNGWDKKSIDEALKLVDTKRAPPKDLQPKPKQISEESPSQTKNQYLQTLRTFIINARNKGVSDMQIKNALLAKKWPQDLVDEGFRQTPHQQQIIKQEPREEPKFETKKPTIKQPREPFDYSKLIWYFVGFLVAGVILAGTIFVYFYVDGLSQYVVVVDGVDMYGRCLELDCSDMKDFAFGHAKDSLDMMLIIGGIIALITVTLYATLPIRNAILWIINILYFLLLVFIGVRWVLFNRSI